MGTQYRVSELMDNYTDNKFLVSERQGTDTEAVLNGVMAKVKPKKHLRLGFKVLAAAAVAAAVSITAAVTATASKPMRVYICADGTVLTIGGEECPVKQERYDDCPDNVYVIENDRVYFTFDGQHLDITDMIDYDTPYCYRSDITDSLGEVHERWIAVGGTPKYIGWAEAIVDCDGNGFTFFSGSGNIWYEQYYIDGEIVIFINLEGTYGYIDKYPYRYADFNWVKEVYEKFEGPHSQEYYENEMTWKYPRDWEGELLDDNIPFPEDLREFE